ncbi:hypothetical protein BDW69DRAFT_204276 [Aspergillus filifer]
MKSITYLTGSVLALAPLALAGDLCLSAACTLAPPDQGPACGWCLGTDLEDYLVNNGPINLDDICGEMVLLTWTDGAPELYMIDVEAGLSWNIKAENIQGSTAGTGLIFLSVSMRMTTCSDTKV